MNTLEISFMEPESIYNLGTESWGLTRDTERKPGIKGPRKMSKVTDEDLKLIEALRQANEVAFSTLIERYHGQLLRCAQTFVSNQAVAEEVVQETWMAVLEGIHRFEGRSSLKTWIFRILINRAKTKGVRESRYVEFPGKAVGIDQEGADSFDESLALGGGPWPGQCLNMIAPQGDVPVDQQLMNKELVHRIVEAIQQLPAMQRKVILLRDVEGVESNETCRMLGLSATNQRVLLHRARSRVRQALAPYTEQPELHELWPLMQCA